ncbi:MAG: GNAT family N-acetyltransferase, partial [Actinomycetota bacterium]|nr:GNAT family N-acetyltransferase [Actinomycetota bacterium]
PHRRVVVADEAAGERLAPRFAALGWRPFRHVWMVHRPGELPLERDPAVEQVAAHVARDLTEEWLRSAPWWEDAEEVSRFAEDAARVDARLPGTAITLAVFDPWPVGFVALREAGDGAEVTDLYITPSHRGRGLSGALLRSAMATARSEGLGDLWIVADTDDWPRTLYERQGFERVWLEHLFTRPSA